MSSQAVACIVTCLFLASVAHAGVPCCGTDFEDIPLGTAYTTPGIEFLSGGIRFETAPFKHNPLATPTYNRVEIDLAVNLGFPPYEQDAHELYPNNSSVIIDFAGSVGTMTAAHISFYEGVGATNFDVNNTDIKTVGFSPHSLDELTDGVVRNGVYMAVYRGAPKNLGLIMYGQIDTVFLGGQELLIRSVGAEAGPLAIAGDLSGDLFVGIEDLNIILSDWNASVEPGSTSDPSGDGFVGIDDLGIVLGNWNAGIPPWALPLVNLPTPTDIPVPEPASATFILLMIGFGLTRRAPDRHLRLSVHQPS